jgi:hypothetical protein
MNVFVRKKEINLSRMPQIPSRAQCYRNISVNIFWQKHSKLSETLFPCINGTKGHRHWPSRNLARSSSIASTQTNNALSRLSVVPCTTLKNTRHVPIMSLNHSLDINTSMQGKASLKNAPQLTPSPAITRFLLTVLYFGLFKCISWIITFIATIASHFAPQNTLICWCWGKWTDFGFDLLSQLTISEPGLPIPNYSYWGNQ